MADSLSRLIVTLEAQTATYQKGLENANRQLSAFKRTQEQTLSTLESGFRRFGAGIAAAFSVAAVSGLNEFIKRQVDAGDALGETADAAGLGAEQMQRLVYAFTQITSASKEGATKGLTAFNAQLGKAREGSVELQKAAHDLGIDLTQNTDVAIEQAFVGLSKIEDASKRAALAGEFFTGRFGKQLAGALDGTTEALDRVRASATGIVDEATIKKLSDMNDEMQRLSGIVDAEMANAIVGNADAFLTLSRALGTVESKAINALAALVALVSQPQSTWDLVQRYFTNVPTYVAPPRIGTVVDAASRAEFGGGMVGPPKPPGFGQGPNTVVDPGLKARTALYDRLMKEQDAAEKASQKSMDDYNEQTVQNRARVQEAAYEEVNKKQLEDEKALSEALGQMDVARIQKLNAESDAFGEQFAANLVEASDAGFKAVLASWARTIQQMILIAAGKSLFKAAFGGAAEGSFLAGVGDVLGGGRASGGPVAAGTSYMVGERGPEMFTPSTSGQITPNGAGGVTVVQNIDARGSSNPQQMAIIMKLAKDSAKAEIQDSLRRRSR